MVTRDDLIQGFIWIIFGFILIIISLLIIKYENPLTVEIDTVTFFFKYFFGIVGSLYFIFGNLLFFQYFKKKFYKK